MISTYTRMRPECNAPAVSAGCRLPEASAVQIDKRDAEWLLTYWLNPAVTIRLRIQHGGYSVIPDVIFYELADRRRGHEFRPVGRVEWRPGDDPPSLPLDQWAASFRELAALWSVLTSLAGWGLALGDTRIVEDNPGSDTTCEDCEDPAADAGRLDCESYA